MLGPFVILGVMGLGSLGVAITVCTELGHNHTINDDVVLSIIWNVHTLGHGLAFLLNQRIAAIVDILRQAMRRLVLVGAVRAVS